MKKCIILANGEPPSKKVFNFFQSLDYNSLICADGGANSAAKLGLIPDFIIGDLDSINPDVLRYFSGKSKIIQIKRQNDTDAEKCLKYAIKNRFSEVILLGSTGDRLDHSFCNIGMVLKYFNRVSIKIVHKKSLLSAYSGNVTLKTVQRETISIYGIDTKTRITSTGLKYQLKNVSLPFGKKESTSNVALQSKVLLKIKGGVVFVIRNFETMRNYGLF